MNFLYLGTCQKLAGGRGAGNKGRVTGENDSKHPSVLQELDFIIYTIGGGSRYFRPRSISLS